MKKLYGWLLIAVLFLSPNIFAQHQGTATKEAPDNWHLLDRTSTGYYGISLDKAYDLLKKNKKKSSTITVAVIDSGIDTTQEDLKPVLWRNSGEIPGNDQDDDRDGYVDNYYGWNFLGNKDGQNVKTDSYEAARVYWNYRHVFDGNVKDTSVMSDLEKYQYDMWSKAKAEILNGSNSMEITMAQRLLPVMLKGDSTIAHDLGKTKYNGVDLKDYIPSSPEAQATASILKNIQQLNDNDEITNEDIINELKGDLRKADAANVAPENFRHNIVEDNYHEFSDQFYGNGDVMTGTPTHGTHCSGIIGAVRNNGKGMDGIADDVRIMMIRAVPDGDEHDKDIAHAIRYAVDRGARVISMSFGKSYSPQKFWVDDAVRYAAEHDVILVHAAGNDAKNIDSADNYPNPDYLFNKGKAKNFITVGASGDPTNGGFTASFSNYGKENVDIFAPGVNIYSTLPGGDKYGKLSGTSMAAPVVAGVAALLRSYFPDLTAEQVKDIIEQSVEPITEKVILPGTQNSTPVMVNLADISKSGGEVNAYNAVRMALKTKAGKK